jgi:NAD(P)-dependent dehydrogenase (short-subunit alcohol dehydrogenase family)
LPSPRHTGDIFGLDGVLAVVTGAARGIGKAAASGLAGAGAELVLFDRLGGQLTETADQIRDETGVPVHTVIGDVSREEDRERLAERCNQHRGTQVLVNSAGVMRRTDVTALTVSDLDYLWQVNVAGTVGVTQLLLPHMIDTGYGKVINVGSLGSVRGLERRTGYATTKGAIAQYTVSLASEVGRHGVRVNAIAPGYVVTDMASEWIYHDPQRTERLRARIPLDAFATPEQLAGVFVFLAAPASDYLTGQVLVADGGWTTT